MDLTTAVRGVKTAGEGAPTGRVPVALVPRVRVPLVPSAVRRAPVVIGRPIRARIGVVARTGISARVPAGVTGGSVRDGPARGPVSSARPVVVAPTVVTTGQTAADRVRAVPPAAVDVVATPAVVHGGPRVRAPGAAAREDVPGTRTAAGPGATRRAVVPRMGTGGAGPRPIGVPIAVRPRVRETTGATDGRAPTGASAPGGRTSSGPRAVRPGTRRSAGRSAAARAAVDRAAADPGNVVTTSGRSGVPSAGAGSTVPVPPVRRVRTGGTAVALATRLPARTAGGVIARATVTGPARPQAGPVGTTTVRPGAAERRRGAPPPHGPTTAVRTGGTGTTTVVETGSPTGTAAAGPHRDRAATRTAVTQAPVPAGGPVTGPGRARTVRRPRIGSSGVIGRSSASVGIGRTRARPRTSTGVRRTGTAPPVRSAPTGRSARPGPTVRSARARRTARRGPADRTVRSAAVGRPTVGSGPTVVRRAGTPGRGASPRRPSRRWCPSRHCRTR